MGMSLSKRQELLMDRGAWHGVVHGVTKSQTRLSHWTELKTLKTTRLVFCVCVCVCARVLSHVWLCMNSMDSSPPGSSVQWIVQARILEWVAISSSRGSLPARDWTYFSCIGRWILYHCATWKVWYFVE